VAMWLKTSIIMSKLLNYYHLCSDFSLLLDNNSRSFNVLGPDNRPILTYNFCQIQDV
jgi:hypothetical protein